MLEEHDREHLRILLGQRIRSLRKQSHLTQEQLAYRIGTSRSFLSRVESGTRVLSFDELTDISDAFTLSVSELLVGIELSDYQIVKVQEKQIGCSAICTHLLL